MDAQNPLVRAAAAFGLGRAAYRQGGGHHGRKGQAPQKEVCGCLQTGEIPGEQPVRRMLQGMFGNVVKMLRSLMAGTSTRSIPI